MYAFSSLMNVIQDKMLPPIRGANSRSITQLLLIFLLNFCTPRFSPPFVTCLRHAVIVGVDCDNDNVRYRRLMAVEAAKKRERARDMALMNRARRQVDSRQQSGKIVKARYRIKQTVLVERCSYKVHASSTEYSREEHIFCLITPPSYSVDGNVNLFTPRHHLTSFGPIVQVVAWLIRVGGVRCACN